MEEIFCTLKELIKEFSLTEVYMPEGGEETHITKNEVNRPGLPLSGYLEHFDRERIQVVGMVEYGYLDSLSRDERAERLDAFFKLKPVLVILSHTDMIPIGFREVAEKYSVPLFHVDQKTSPFMAALISSLSVKLAPMISRHGVFVEVYGEGILITGDSGIGKSEAAIELVKRGHRLVADDSVEIRRVSDKTLVGSAPEIIRHYIELRGIGIVDVRRIFGMGAVKNTEKIDLVINLEQWDKDKFYDRFGLETEYTEIMGLKIPSITIPVKPGRNLAVIIEIAAMNHRQKKMGYNTAVEFNKKLMGEAGLGEER
ncbi:MAG: HPr(Ser) kinase/phosphatase [Clostridia bacterium]|nr:HPr(Ser) kinase/phosphatase [Clostridia bacterium]